MSGVSQRYGKTKYRDTISELYDNDEKDAVFRSSMKKGGAVHDFNMSYKPPVQAKESPEKSFGGFGGGFGKENK